MLDYENECRYIVDTGDMRFDWDQSKNISNINKHGISFEEATTAFNDNQYIEIDDPEHSDYEERFIIYGISVQNRLLAVCHTIKEDETCRIISARKATSTEEKQYGEKTNARRI